MADVYKIPLMPGTPQMLIVTMGVKEYRLTLQYRDVDQDGLWTLDIVDVASNVEVISGIPLVTGADLLAQYRFLNIAGGLVVYTDGEPDAVPSFENLGASGNLYFVVQ